MPMVSLRSGQYKRLGRLSAKNPGKAEDVARRMVERRSRITRGKEFVNKNITGLYPNVPAISSGTAPASRKGSKVVKKKMAKGGTLGMKSVKAGFDKNPGVTRADIIVAAKKQARGGSKVKKAKSGAALKKQAATAIAMKKAGKAPKMMKKGGSMKKCRGGCY